MRSTTRIASSTRWHGEDSFAGEQRLPPTRRHEALCGKVVNLLGMHAIQDVDERQLIEQVGLVQRDSRAKMGDVDSNVCGTGTANDAVNVVPFFQQQQLGQVRAVFWPVMPVINAAGMCVVAECDL